MNTTTLRILSEIKTKNKTKSNSSQTYSICVVTLKGLYIGTSYFHGIPSIKFSLIDAFIMNF